MTELSNSLLVIMAHPDDAELWAGGTIALYSQFSKVFILVSSNDKERSIEAREGAKKLGAEIICINEITRDVCMEYIGEISPNIIITHRTDDPHPDHRMVGKIVFDILPKAYLKFKHPQKAYTCDTYNSIAQKGKVEGSVIIDVTSTFEIKIEALKCHISQPIEYFSKMAITLGNLWGARIGKEKGEAFDPIPILGILPGYDRL